MARRKVKVWFDREADYLEVLLEQREGFFREISALTKSPLEVVL